MSVGVRGHGQAKSHVTATQDQDAAGVLAEAMGEDEGYKAHREGAGEDMVACRQRPDNSCHPCIQICSRRRRRRRRDAGVGVGCGIERGTVKVKQESNRNIVERETWLR